MYWALQCRVTWRAGRCSSVRLFLSWVHVPLNALLHDAHAFSTGRWLIALLKHAAVDGTM